MNKSLKKLLFVLFLAIISKIYGENNIDRNSFYCSNSKTQLLCYKFTQSYSKQDVLTTVQGQPIGDRRSKTIGRQGPMLLEDTIFLKSLAHFDRERIPERVVHAKGAGAFGTFRLTNELIQNYSKAAVFSKVNKTTPIFVRFSQVAGELGAAETVRDVRGFAIKFYTDEGIWDLVGNNLPVFFVRDGQLFPSFIHSQKRNPATHLHDPNMVWDFFSLRNESALQMLHLYSNLGIPASYRKMNGFGVHAFKLVNAERDYIFCKFNYYSQQGIENMTNEEGVKTAGTAPDFLLKDLYDAIARKEFPKWTLKIQLMTKEQTKQNDFNPFDATKLWPKDKFPEIEIGELELNKNPSNYFAQVEQAAFDPANMPPGIEPSPDKLLQSRLFSYLDTQYYRLGVNFNQLPINEPINKVITPLDRDGVATLNDNHAGMPNYYPNSFLNADFNSVYKESSYTLDESTVDRYDFDSKYDMMQATEFYKNLSIYDKCQLALNIAGHLKEAIPDIQRRMLNTIRAIDPDLSIDVKMYMKPKRGIQLAKSKNACLNSN